MYHRGLHNSQDYLVTPTEDTYGGCSQRFSRVGGLRDM